jgi:hypothetical protein
MVLFRALELPASGRSAQGVDAIDVEELFEAATGL